MPELPDVEVFRQRFDIQGLNREIVNVSVPVKRLLEDVSSNRLERSLKGHRFTKTCRIGKYLFACDDNDDWLVLHFGMTGALEFPSEAEAPDPQYAALSLQFSDDSRLFYTNKRKLGRISLTNDVDQFVKKHGLGPDVLQLDKDSLLAVLKKKKGLIKSALMDQNTLAGIGNVYSDEILYQAKINPHRATETLTKHEWQRIVNKTFYVLEQAINRHANPQEFPATWLTPNRTAGAKCPRCKGDITKKSVSGRSSYFCKSCQAS